ncbi:outer membrane-stress sensor serine endopeptidase DegS [Pectobacterium brasiliense]|uniref:Outer membrane-stress sensor serine endopeptidase DegS n=2 Tax=Pectobacterium TaxID=122277 RepID=A0A9Q2EYX6_9GAMM|nr:MULTISPECIES: outer membrane-stress sensor serine endopeptidase DegS [Pectobacterium]MBA0218513.1 outer membrane-stress sensor serine endopeptidase DegS [Pectobacterium brasiliense]MBE5204289.1 outer membrane-stress sensor serine endopeptidase DegS [Pectobacterium quasiaquaticum]MBE5209342.1 outer membrane-stress sensor serine endopeptidase DegS [Pectobacterium quasiaquaticum]MBE5213899.1 outer membrane-stress sensor serine endopeptidase DegS [Pectobacterium quasiaquaticum]MBE5220178.1 oute
MLAKLLRSALFGALVAGIILAVLPFVGSGTSFLKGNDKNSDGLPISYHQGVSHAAPAVVNVYNRVAKEGKPNEVAIHPLGSGVIMNEKGYILTNKHVINNVQQIQIELSDGRLYEARVIGSDSLTDLAVLQIDGINLPVIPINPDRIPHVGDVVMAIGNPYNLGQTVTQGVISATGRVSLSTYGQQRSQVGRQNLLQTDASINHGNSGGALVNTLGELVGINTLSFDKSSNGETPEGISFAIPVALATKVMGKLIRDGRVVRGYIGVNGVQIENIENSTLTNNRDAQDRLSGILVQTIDPGGPADKAGIRVEDVIVSVNNKPARSIIETMEQVSEIRPGTVIPVTIVRDKNQITLQMTIQEFPTQ